MIMTMIIISTFLTVIWPLTKTTTVPCIMMMTATNSQSYCQASHNPYKKPLVLVCDGTKYQLDSNYNVCPTSKLQMEPHIPT